MHKAHTVFEVNHVGDVIAAQEILLLRNMRLELRQQTLDVVAHAQQFGRRVPDRLDGSVQWRQIRLLLDLSLALGVILRCTRNAWAIHLVSG